MDGYRKGCVVFLITLFAFGHALGFAHAEQNVVNLQKIIDEAQVGDKLVLEPGIYTGPVSIDKPITIQADQLGTVILKNTSSHSAMTINAEHVTITGLHIIDEHLKEAPTVLVQSDHVKLEQLHIETGADGIVIREADDGSVSGVEIRWVPQGIAMAEKGNAIDLYEADRWQITQNTIANVHDGIYLENSDDTKVIDNVIELSRYGVHCMYTKRTVIEQNRGKRNVTGAMIMATQQVSVKDNIFTKQNENVNSQGILLYDAHETEVVNNIVEGNRVGLYIEQSTENLLESNEINYNFVGIQLLDASDNTIRQNQFIGNVSDAQARGSEQNTMTRNYWDTFRGIDIDGDGTSDTAYAVNPFFQALTLKRPQYQLFFRSPGMMFLEGLYQTDQETWVTDNAPLMVPSMTGTYATTSGRDVSTGLTGVVLLGCTSVIFYFMRRRSE